MLNLVETRSERGPRADRGAAGRALPRRSRRRGARRTSSASPGRRASASPRCCRGWSPNGAAASARWRCWPSIPARGARAARCSATAPGSSAIPPTPGVFIRSTAAGDRLGGLAPGDPGGRHRAGGRVRRGGDRDRRCRPVRDRGRGRRRHGRGRGPARLGRRAAVPEVRDHGDPRRAGGDQSRPRARWPTRARRRPDRRAARARRRRHAGAGGVLGVAPASGIDELVDALDAHRGALDLPPAGCAAGGCTRWPTSSPSTASAGCARSAAGARPSGGWPSRTPAPTWRRCERALEREAGDEPSPRPPDRAPGRARWSTAHRAAPVARLRPAGAGGRLPGPGDRALDARARATTAKPTRAPTCCQRHDLAFAGLRGAVRGRRDADDGDAAGLDLADADRLGAPRGPRSATGWPREARGHGHATRAVRLICAWGVQRARPGADRSAGRDRKPGLPAGGPARRLHPRGGAALLHARHATSARTWSPSACWATELPGPMRSAPRTCGEDERGRRASRARSRSAPASSSAAALARARRPARPPSPGCPLTVIRRTLSVGSGRSATNDLHRLLGSSRPAARRDARPARRQHLRAQRRRSPWRRWRGRTARPWPAPGRGWLRRRTRRVRTQRPGARSPPSWAHGGEG